MSCRRHAAAAARRYAVTAAIKMLPSAAILRGLLLYALLRVAATITPSHMRHTRATMPLRYCYAPPLFYAFFDAAIRCRASRHIAALAARMLMPLPFSPPLLAATRYLRSRRPVACYAPFFCHMLRAC